MKKTTIICVMALLCLNFCGRAQNSTPQIELLKLQQSLPPQVWEEPIQILSTTGNLTTIKLSAFKGKLIILDFWATWCTACLQTLPHLDSLQNKYGDKVQILLVNASIKGDTQAKIQARLKGYQIISIINNLSLKQLFPHEYIPHYVWIDAEGKFYALTTSAMLNAGTIENYLNSKH